MFHHPAPPGQTKDADRASASPQLVIVRGTISLQLAGAIGQIFDRLNSAVFPLSCPHFLPTFPARRVPMDADNDPAGTQARRIEGN